MFLSRRRHERHIANILFMHQDTIISCGSIGCACLIVVSRESINVSSALGVQRNSSFFPA